MFSNAQNRLVSLATLLVTYSIIFNSLRHNGRSRFAQAGLIEIYHKYRSNDLPAEQSNGSVQLAARTSDYASPMKRIMDIINHHSPLIVVASDASSASQATSEQPSTGIQSPDSKQQQTQSSVTTAALSSQPVANQMNQHPSWQSLDMLLPSIGGQMSAQQQQLVQTSLPYEQYYLEPNTMIPQQNMANAAVGGQIALLSPANLAFHSPSAGYQQIATIPYPTTESQVNQQPVTQSMQGLDDRAQPIFLSSYVPEIPTHLVKPNMISNMQTEQIRPDSIQQVQLTQQRGKETSLQLDKPSSSNTGSNTVTNSQSTTGNKKTQNNEEPEDSSTGSDPNGDTEETNKKRQASSSFDDPDEPVLTNGGSLTFEDKYDSDKDDTPKTSKKGQTSDDHEQLSAASNGLVSVGLNDDCLQCICRASSGCDHLLRCITRGSEDKYCGPFQLTEEYWNKAGSPGDQASNFISFEDCANDADCAVETVTNYMKKYHKDCDGDENITCMDYARLHRLAPHECDNTDKLVNNFDAYWAKFQRCAEGYNRSRNGDDEDI